MKDGRIAYCINWNKDIERTWSGTPYSLRCALLKRVSIEDYPLGSGTRMLDRFESRARKLFGVEDMGISIEGRMDRRFRKTHADGLPNVFIQLGRAPLPIGNERHYVYQDLCVRFLRECAEHDPVLFRLSGYGPQKKTALQRAEKLQDQFYEKAAGIFCMGHWLANYLVSYCGLPEAKVHWIGAGCNAFPLSDDSIPRTGNKILFVGRDFERKGGFEALSAFPKVRKEIPSAQLLIAGPRIPIDSSIDGVTWLGDISIQKISELMSQVDAFVMPSYFEAFGIVFVEAAAAGLPIVARDAFEMPYLVDDKVNGRLVAKDARSEEIADAILEVLTEPRFRRAAMERREEICKTYSWDAVAARMLSVIEVDARS